MLNFERGCRRLAWVVTVPLVLLAGAFAYEESSAVVGYQPVLLDSGYPDLHSPYSVTKPVVIDSLGLLHVPSALTNAEISVVIRDHFTKQKNPAAFAAPPGRRSISAFEAAVRKKRPEYASLAPVILTKRVVTDFPVYRNEVAFREYVLQEKRAKRPVWALAVSAMAALIIVAAFQGGISVVAWVLRGFRSAA